MQRYWLELWRVVKERGGEEWISSPLGEPAYPIERASRLYRALRNYLLYPRLASRAGDEGGIYHILDHSYVHLAKGLRRGDPLVVTVHDLIPLRDESGLTPSQVSRFRRRMEWLKRADRIVAVSKFTRGEVIKLMGVSPERIVVVPNGTAFELVESERPRGEVAERIEKLGRGGIVRLLAVGSNLARKNLGILPTVCRRLRERGVECAVIKVGAVFPEGLREELRVEVGQEGVIELGLISDGLLKWVYENSDILFFPSRLEGFGIPVIEAMQCGCRVVCSREASLPEVGGDVAFYFDVDDSEEAAVRVMEAIRDEGGRGDAGRAWAERFTWDRHFDGLMETYRSLARGGTAGK